MRRAGAKRGYMADESAILDLVVIGGGVNGAGVARDAAGRGLKVALLEQGDLASGTSSASTKLIHGGLRYLEFYAFGLVRKALAEREVILANAPHIARPLPFLLPLERGLRPAWMVRAGLFLYDHLARRREVPGSSAVRLRQDAAGPAFRADLDRAFRYWDGWIDDARLVVLNARDAARRGAAILPQEAAVAARYHDRRWEISTSRGRTLAARVLLNAAGPWAETMARDLLGLVNPPRLHLVAGSHIVTRRVNRTADAWMLQQPDRRIVFVIPYEQDYSLIGTTEREVSDPATRSSNPDEENYLLAAVNRSLAKPLAAHDIIWRYTGVRPLVLEEGKGARETTRDWRLVSHPDMAAMTVIGGKITTYRLLAEAVLKQLFPQTRAWTIDAPLPGGDVAREHGETAGDAFARWLRVLKATHPDYDPRILDRMAHLWGTDTEAMLDSGLGRNFDGVFEAELAHMRDREWAHSAEDMLWRRSKLGLHLSAAAQQQVRDYVGR